MQPLKLPTSKSQNVLEMARMLLQATLNTWHVATATAHVAKKQPGKIIPDEAEDAPAGPIGTATQQAVDKVDEGSI